MRLLVLLFAVLLAFAPLRDCRSNNEQYNNDFPFVTFGSAIKLLNQQAKYFLHSHSIAYGTGSTQQSVTAHESPGDAGNMFQLLPAFNEDLVLSGTRIKCGESVVRLRHLQTGKDLHSHLHKSPISHQQEVSCFGSAEGDGDTGDNWIVLCDSEWWQRGKEIRLRHVDTNMYLSARRANMFTQSNCPHCPIVGQLEVYGQSDKSAITAWVANEGIYIPSVPDEDAAAQ